MMGRAPFGILPSFAPMQDMTNGGYGTPPIAPTADERAANDGVFTWGAAGARLTPEQLIQRQKQIAGERAAGLDFSPVGHWTQGLARVANAFLANRDQSALDKDVASSNDARAKIIAALGAGDVPRNVVAQAMADTDPVVQELGGKVYDRQNPKPVAPHYWEMNDGSLGMVGADGQPRTVYKDPTPKINWLTAQNPDGTKTLVPMGPTGPLTGGGGPVSSAPAGGSQPPATLPPDFDFGQGGAAPQAPSPFQTR